MLSYKTMRVNGYDMAYVERGSGVPVILVHGAISDYRYWTSQMRPFSEQYRAVSVSLRHCYPEQWDGKGGGCSFRQHVEDMASFIEQLNAGQVHVVGHSRGADVALLLAAARPDLVRKLVLAEPAPINAMLPETRETRAGMEKYRIIFGDALAALQRGDRDNALKQFVDAVNYPGAWEKVPDIQKEIFRDNAWSLKSLQADADEPLTCSEVGKFEGPVLFVTGEKSAGIYKLMSESLRQCFKRHKSITIPKASHPMNQMNPEAFNAGVLDFLEKN